MDARKLIKNKDYENLLKYIIDNDLSNLVERYNIYNKKIKPFFKNIYIYNSKLLEILTNDFSTYLPRGLGVDENNVYVLDWFKNDEDSLSKAEIKLELIKFIESLIQLKYIKLHLNSLTDNNTNRINSIYIQSYITNMEGVLKDIFS